MIKSKSSSCFKKLSNRWFCVIGGFILLLSFSELFLAVHWGRFIFNLKNNHPCIEKKRRWKNSSHTGMSTSGIAMLFTSIWKKEKRKVPTNWCGNFYDLVRFSSDLLVKWVRYQNVMKQHQFVLFQTVFVSNPFLGLLILLSIFITDMRAGAGCAIGGLIATLTDHFLGLHPQSLADNGVSSFNGSLLGTVLPALFSLVSDNQTQLWIAVCFGAFARY